VDDLRKRSIYDLVATRMKLLNGVVLTKYCTAEEREEWRMKADEITAELTRRNEGLE
jgi:hypothetical protein